VTGVLDGQGALVTGGGSGIGLATAKRLAADGAVVTICGRSKERLDAALEELGGAVRAVAADVTAEDDVVAAVTIAADAPGGLRIAVACAGGSSHMGPLVATGVDEFRATVDVNVIGTFLTVKHADGSKVRRGPYPLLTRKEAKKTVSVRLTDPALVPLYRRQLQAMREFETVVNQLVRVGAVAYLGQKQTRTSLIARTTQIPTEAPMERGTMLAAESRLYDLSIFDWSSVGPRRPITDQTEEMALVKRQRAGR